MREARIILPQKDNDGHDLTTVHEALQLGLCRKFGGFTAYNATGGWLNTETGTTQIEPVVVYDISMANAMDDHAELRSVARNLKTLAGQTAIYVRFPDGNVCFV